MESAPLQLFGLLKLVRVLRLGRIIMYMNLKADMKMVRFLEENTFVVSEDHEASFLFGHVPPLRGLCVVFHRAAESHMDSST